jgi:hypothetical protein
MLYRLNARSIKVRVCGISRINSPRASKCSISLRLSAASSARRRGPYRQTSFRIRHKTRTKKRPPDTSWSGRTLVASHGGSNAASGHI